MPVQRQPLLMAYVRYLSDGQTMKELLFCKNLKTDNKRQTKHQTLIAIMQINLSLLQIYTDVAPAMVPDNTEFLSLLRK